MRSCGKRQDPILRTVSPVSQNAYVKQLNQLLFSKVGNMLHFDIPAFVEIISEGFRIREQNTVSQPQTFCKFSLSGSTHFD